MLSGQTLTICKLPRKLVRATLEQHQKRQVPLLLPSFPEETCHGTSFFSTRRRDQFFFTGSRFGKWIFCSEGMYCLNWFFSGCFIMPLLLNRPILVGIPTSGITTIKAPLGACLDEFLGCRLFRSLQFDDFFSRGFHCLTFDFLQNWPETQLLLQSL